MLGSRAYQGSEVRLPMSLGERVRRVREARGMSVADLAHAARLSPAHVYNIESGLSGAKRPTIALLEALAGALDVTVDDLLDTGSSGGTVAAPTVPDAAKRLAYLVARGQEAAELERFLLTWARLPDRVKRLMIMQAETYDELSTREGTENDEDGDDEGGESENEG